jgi:hypothetical protein
MTYAYKTPVGTFFIRPHRSDRTRVELWVGEECYGSYGSARFAASDVYGRATGFNAWDASRYRASEDLADWEQIPD